jgi:hypothetical protein
VSASDAAVSFALKHPVIYLLIDYGIALIIGALVYFMDDIKAFNERQRLSVPAGFTESGLPVGIQIVGRHRDDFGILQLAHAFEQKTLFAQRKPPICTSQ